MNRCVAILAALLLATVGVASAAAPGGLRFTIEHGGGNGRVQLSLRERSIGRASNWSSTIALADPHGLGTDELVQLRIHGGPRPR